jgi:hypothetical protein
MQKQAYTTRSIKAAQPPGLSGVQAVSLLYFTANKPKLIPCGSGYLSNRLQQHYCQ